MRYLSFSCTFCVTSVFPESDSQRFLWWIKYFTRTKISRTIISRELFSMRVQTNLQTMEMMSWWRNLFLSFSRSRFSEKLQWKWTSMKTLNVILKKKQTNKQVNSNFPWSVLFYHGNDTHVQYSRLDSSGQNLESNGVWSKNETGSTVESTRVTGSLVIRWNRKCKKYFERGVRSRPMESIGSTGNTSIPMESPEV